MLAAIALNDVGELRDLAAPPCGARAPRSPAASCARGVADAADRARDRAGEQRARRRPRRVAEPAATARIFPSAPMWNITQPESEHGGERHADGEEREPGELEPDRRRGAQREGDGEPDREARAGDDEREADHGSNR